MSRPVAVRSTPERPRVASPPPSPAPTPLSLVPASSLLPPRVFAIAAGASLSGGLSAAALGWPLWSMVVVALVPWLPLYVRDLAEVTKRNPWLAVFYFVAVSQSGHVIEHAAQMIQLHALHLPPPRSRGIFGALDIEWVHFVWNTTVLLATASLLVVYRHSRLLAFAVIFAVWHQVEHTWIMSTYLRTGNPGSPGLLSAGGAIGGGLPLKRPDVHFLYNIVETAPLLAAFAIETVRARRTSAIQDAARARRRSRTAHA
ncbi:MAG TPA: hypothetical protein VGB64_01785 [Actinomycetota bacterium]